MFSESTKHITILKNIFRSPHPSLKNLNDKKNTIIKANKEQIDKLKMKVQSLNRDIARIGREKQGLLDIKSGQDAQLAKIGDEKLAHARRIVALEEEMVAIEADEASVQRMIGQGEEALRRAKMPSVDDFFVQIVKGFNLRFADDKLQIKNLKRNKFFEIELNDVDVDTVWHHMS